MEVSRIFGYSSLFNDTIEIGTTNRAPDSAEKEISTAKPLLTGKLLPTAPPLVSSLELLQHRVRRSPCLDNLIRGCAGRSRQLTGSQVLDNLRRSNADFFRTPPSTPPLWRVHYRTSIDDLDRVLEKGLPTRPGEEIDEERVGAVPKVILEVLEEERREVLMQARARMLEHMSTAASANISVEIDTVLAEQLTGYPFEPIVDIIQNHGARLIDEDLVEPGTLKRTISSAMLRRSLPSALAFLGPRIPPEAFVAIYQREKCIWRRPTEMMEATPPIFSSDSDTRYERILNIAIGYDEDVALAQRYLHRKHPSKTGNYILHPSVNTDSPQLERIGAAPDRTSPPPIARIHVVGNSGSPTRPDTPPFGEITFTELCESLTRIVKEQRRMGKIGVASTLSIEFVACGTFSQQQTEELQNIFRAKSLQTPSVTHRDTIENGVGVHPAEEGLDFIVGLAPNQYSIRMVQTLQRLHPASIEYNIRRPGPHVRNPVIFRTHSQPLQSPAPPEHLRINIIGHGGGTDAVGGMSAPSLAQKLATLVREGQLNGELNAEARVTLSFVACKVASDQFSNIYQIFKDKGVQLSRIIYRDTNLMVDTAGRKLQQRPDGTWQRSYQKHIFQFNINGTAHELPEFNRPNRPDFLTLQHAAGPLATTVEAQHHVRQITKTLDQLRLDNQLNEEWRPQLESLTQATAQHQITFRRSEEAVTVTTSDRSLQQFNTFLKTHAEEIGRRHQFDGDTLTPLESSQSTASNGGPVSHLNRVLGSIAAIRTLANLDRNSYSAEIRGHTLVNIAQSVHGLGNEAVSLADAVRTAFGRASVETPAGLRAGKFIGAVNRTMGRGLVAASVGFDIYELSQAKTQEEKVEAGVNLGLDGAALGLELASIAGLASTVTGPLGLLLIFAAFAVELGWKIHRQHPEPQGMLEEILRYFDGLRKAYNGGAVRYDAGRDTLSFAPEAVVTDITLGVAPKVRFDSQSLMVPRTRITCTRNNLTFQNPVPSVTQQGRARPLNIRDTLNWPQEGEISPAAALAAFVFLPATPITKWSYGYQGTGVGAMEFSNDDGYAVARQLEARHSRFIFESCGMALGSLSPRFEDTPIAIHLGPRDRILATPQIRREIAEHLQYTLEGGGGAYRIYPARNAHFTLRDTPDTAPASTWLIDLSELDGVDDLDSTITAETLTFHDAVQGPIRINIAGIKGKIEIRSKLRQWQLDRQLTQLRLLQMDLGGNEIPGSAGARLQRDVRNRLELSGVRSAHELRAPQDWMLPFQNQSVKMGDTLRLDRFPIGAGTVIYEPRSKRLITSGSDKLSSANFIGQANSSFYFSMGRMFWLGAANGETLSEKHREQSLFFLQQAKKNNVTAAWLQGGSIFIAQTVSLQKEGDSLEAIYRLNEAGQPLLIKLTVPEEDFRSRNPTSASEAFRAIEELAAAPQSLLPSALDATATKSNLISLICRNPQGGEKRFWLDITQNELVALDDSLPTDSVPFATTNSGGVSGSTFFYSDSTKSLYRRMGHKKPFSPPTPSARLMEHLHAVKLVDGRLQVETADGVIYEINAQDDKRLIAVSARWLKAHQSTWANDVLPLGRDLGTADSVEIQGLQLANGKGGLPCWYDKVQKQFAFAPESLANEKLLHLGSVTQEAGAWIFQPSTGRLYQQPTFTAEWAALSIDRNGILTLPTSKLAPPYLVLPNEKMDRVARLEDGRVIAFTQSGLTLLLEAGMQPLVLAVNQNWLSQEANQRAHLSQLVSDENYRFHWNIDLPASGSPSQARFVNWYDVEVQKIIAAPLEKLPAGVDYVGYATADDTAYFGSPTTLTALREGEGMPPVVSTRFRDPGRDKNILSLRVMPPEPNQKSVPPMLAGVDTLLLHGRIDALTISPELWNHHRLILLNRMPLSDTIANPRADTIELSFAGAENLVLKRAEDDLILELPSPANFQRLVLNRFFASSQTWNLRLLDGTCKYLSSGNTILATGETKPLASLPAT